MYTSKIYPTSHSGGVDSAPVTTQPNAMMACVTGVENCADKMTTCNPLTGGVCGATAGAYTMAKVAVSLFGLTPACVPIACGGAAAGALVGSAVGGVIENKNKPVTPSSNTSTQQKQGND